MELEIGLKITKTIDGSQSADFHIIKDRGGPLFLSQETQTMFLLTSHLKGYKQDDIKININKDGTLIEISGEKTVQEMVMKGWLMFKKEPEIRGFKKTFKIPRGVILDGIKAKYNEEDSILTIYMPKESKGKTGDQIEEVKDEQEVTDEDESEDESKDVKQANQMDETPRKSKVGKEEEEEEEEEVSDGLTPLDKLKREDQEIQEDEGTKVDGRSTLKEDEMKEGEIREKAEISKQGEAEGDTIHRGEGEQVREDDGDEGAKLSEDYHQESVKDVAKKTSGLFAPCFFMGTAIVIPLMVLVFSFIRPKKKQS